MPNNLNVLFVSDFNARAPVADFDAFITALEAETKAAETSQLLMEFRT